MDVRQPSESSPGTPGTPGTPGASHNGGTTEERKRPKRHQTTKACDQCRKMKIRCERDGQVARCTHCTERGLECVLAAERKKRVVKKKDHLASITKRLQEMEGLLSAAGLSPNPQASVSSGTQLRDRSEERPLPPQDSLTRSYTEASVQPGHRPQKRQSDVPSHLNVTQIGKSDFRGSSSAFSFFSDRGLAWVAERAGNDSLRRKLMEFAQSDQSLINNIWRPLDEHNRQPLPSREDALPAINSYFRNFNKAFPLYDRDIFNVYFEQQYSQTKPNSISWYASYNIILAMGGMCDDVRIATSNHERHNSQYWRYFLNAASCFLDLQFGNPDLMAIQSLLGLAVITQASPNPHYSNILIAAAARLAINIGLHHRLAGNSLSFNETKNRRDIFRIIYVFEKGMSLRFGRPSVLSDEDILMSLPEDDPEQYFPIYPCRQPTGDSPMVNGFVLSVRLAVLESKIYRELYSESAKKKSERTISDSINKLDLELQQWKDELPFEVQPESIFSSNETPQIAIIMLHFTYYNCLATIHRRRLTDGIAYTEGLHNYGSNKEGIQSSKILMMNAARSIMYLMKFVTEQNNELIWVALYFPVSASIALFANILNNPHDPQNRTDCKLLDTCLEALATPALLDTADMSSKEMGIVGVIKCLVTIAKEVVAKADLARASGSSLERPNTGSNGKNMQSASTVPITEWRPNSPHNPQQPWQNIGSNPTFPNMQQNAPLGIYTQPTSIPQILPQNTGSGYMSNLPAQSLADNQEGANAFPMPGMFEWDLANLWTGGFDQGICSFDQDMQDADGYNQDIHWNVT